MNGQMKKYRESLENTPEPILLSQIQKKVDLRGVMAYAREKGVHVAQLSEQEKSKFIIQ
ncbi:MAG: hypothetical protein LUF30_10290 [Lachnospiraceae bacterium]|nr:hypothetical protein [Lachnospiraceae bacterium]